MLTTDRCGDLLPTAFTSLRGARHIATAVRHGSRLREIAGLPMRKEA